MATAKTPGTPLAGVQTYYIHPVNQDYSTNAPVSVSNPFEGVVSNCHEYFLVSQQVVLGDFSKTASAVENRPVAMSKVTAEGTDDASLKIDFDSSNPALL